MTEVVVGNAAQDNNSNAEAHPPSTSAGQLLRQAREAKQMSVESLASALKVPVYKLKALEEDRWEQLTDSVFTRSLALGVCRVLRIPSEPVLALLPKLQGAKLSTNPEGINAPFKEKSLRSIMAPSQDTASSKVVKGTVALLIAVAGGAGLYFLPQWQSSEEADVDQQASQIAPESKAQEPLIASSQAPANVASPASSEAAPMAAPVPAVVEPALKESDAPEQAASVVDTTTASAPATAPGAEAASPQDAAVPGRSVLRFTATGQSWVQVKDTKQRVVMEKILQAGDVYEQTVAGRPLQVVVGNTGVTKLEIDGAAWNLAASAKNNVARFEVK